MKIPALLILVLMFAAPHDTGEDIVARMHAKYAGKWMKSFTFTQTTESYRNDSLIKTSTWYEHIIYPDKFRIDFGNKDSGNAAIFTKDSVYRFKNTALVRTYGNDDNLTFLLGGMFFYPLDSVKIMLCRSGYDLSKSYETKLNGSDVYVIGAGSNNEKSNQLWIDKQKLIVVKFISYKNGEKEEGIFYNHRQFENGWSETACDFYVNDKLVQKEKYYDCKANEAIDIGMFDPHKFILIQ
ncbi:MAG: LolA family protein [Parafilimonas sp.]